MVLIIDVGNTHTVYGLFDNNGVLLNYWRKRTDISNTSDELGLFVYEMLKYEGVSKEDIKDVAVSSVVPNVMYSLNHMIQKYFGLKAFYVSSDSKISFNICYDNPSELGADRIANIEGALLKYKPPMIIIDMGTATTFCALDRDLNYLGGNIIPGVGISMNALYQKAAQLRRIEIGDAEKYIATNTVDGMKSGIYFGYIGLIEKVIEGFKKEMGDDDITVIATGGISSTFENDVRGIDHIDKLVTLNGIYQIYLNNK